MASIRVEKELARKAIEAIIQRGKHSVGEYTVIPKAVVTVEGELLIFTKYLREYLREYNIRSVIVDVYGMYNYVTQIEICKDGKVIYKPKRDAKKIVEFVKTLSFST